MAEENLQARVRGTLLMALSNKLGGMVLATGNKSEIAVGYSTLYGDMVGGFAPIRDVAKTTVYDLARWRNATAGHGRDPPHSIERAPSAELRPDQRDTDSPAGLRRCSTLYSSRTWKQTATRTTSAAQARHQT